MLGVPGSEYCVLLHKKPQKLVDIPLPRPRPNPGHDLSYDQAELPKLNPGQFRTDTIKVYRPKVVAQ